MASVLHIDQLTRPLTRAEAKEFLYTMLAATGMPVTSWQEGAVARTIIALCAAAIAGSSEVIAVVIRGMFLELAEGIWLTLLAKYVYNLTRIEATFAAGTVTLTNTAGGVFNDVQPGELIVSSPSTDKTYTNTEVFSLAAFGTATVSVRAVEAGSASTALTGTITAFVTALNGVTVTNASPLVGRDAELDPALRQRCRDSLGALSPNGPAAAYEAIVKTVLRPDGTLIDVNRLSIPSSSATGLIAAVVASSSGEVAPGDLPYIQTAFAKQALPTGQTVTVESAEEATINFVGTIWIDAASTLSDGDVETAADERLDTYFQSIRIGGLKKVVGVGKVWVDALEGQIFQVLPGIAVEVDLTSPATDVLLTSTQVPVRGTSTWTIERVQQT